MLFSLSDFAIRSEIRGEKRLSKEVNFFPLRRTLFSFEILPSEESCTTTAPFAFNVSVMRFPAIEAPPIEDRSVNERIFNKKLL